MISSIQKTAHIVPKSSESTSLISVISPTKPKKFGTNLGFPGQVLEQLGSETYVDLLFHCKSKPVLKIIDLESAHILFEGMHRLSAIPQHSHIVDVQVGGVLLLEHHPFNFYKKKTEDVLHLTSMDDSSKYACKMLDNICMHALIVGYMKWDKLNSVLKIHCKTIRVFDPGSVYMASYEQGICYLVAPAKGNYGCAHSATDPSLPTSPAPPPTFVAAALLGSVFATLILFGLFELKTKINESKVLIFDPGGGKFDIKELGSCGGVVTEHLPKNRLQMCMIPLQNPQAPRTICWNTRGSSQGIKVVILACCSRLHPDVHYLARGLDVWIHLINFVWHATANEQGEHHSFDGLLKLIEQVKTPQQETLNHLQSNTVRRYWMNLQQLTYSFPTFDFEDKVGFRGDGNDTVSHSPNSMDASQLSRHTIKR